MNEKYVIKKDETVTTIWTAEELELLFPNKIQRDIFINGIGAIINTIMDRTSLHGVKLHFD